MPLVTCHSGLVVGSCLGGADVLRAAGHAVTTVQAAGKSMAHVWIMKALLNDAQ